MTSAPTVIISSMPPFPNLVPPTRLSKPATQPGYHTPLPNPPSRPGAPRPGYQTAVAEPHCPISRSPTRLPKPATEPRSPRSGYRTPLPDLALPYPATERRYRTPLPDLALPDPATKPWYPTPAPAPPPRSPTPISAALRPSTCDRAYLCYCSNVTCRISKDNGHAFNNRSAPPRPRLSDCRDDVHAGSFFVLRCYARGIQVASRGLPLPPPPLARLCCSVFYNV